jgi:hypothetical protein
MRLAIAASLLLATQIHAADLPLPQNGWASWHVDAVEDAPASCCWSNSRTCDLDNDKQSFGPRDHARTDAVRVYAKLANGRVQKLHTFAASCPVTSKSPIQNLDAVSTDDSARWLIGLERAGFDRDQWLSSLAMHRGDVAFNKLRDMARAEGDEDAREKSIFWLGVMRGTAGADIVADILLNDRDADVREHATFALAQSKSPRITEQLIHTGNHDASGDVREKAWFWLAQSEAPEAEQAIVAAAKNDKDEDVREQAIFALSQLPDDRATRALIAAAEDRSLSQEQRKRALFWLAQSDTAGAQNYLDKVLTGATR